MPIKDRRRKLKEKKLKEASKRCKTLTNYSGSYVLTVFIFSVRSK